MNEKKRNLYIEELSTLLKDYQVQLYLRTPRLLVTCGVY